MDYEIVQASFLDELNKIAEANENHAPLAQKVKERLSQSRPFNLAEEVGQVAGHGHRAVENLAHKIRNSSVVDSFRAGHARTYGNKAVEPEKSAAAVSFAKEKGLGRVKQLFTGERAKNLGQRLTHLNTTRDEAVARAAQNAYQKDPKNFNRVIEAASHMNEALHKTQKNLTAERSAVTAARGTAGVTTAGGLLYAAARSVNNKKKRLSEGEDPEKTAAELTETGREHIKAKNFALSAKQSDTGKPAYPIHDKAHAANALARVKQFGSPAEKREVYKDVAKKFPELAARSDVPAVKARAKEAGVLQNVRQALTSPKGEHAVELAGLGVLAVPGLDTLQAKLRSRHDQDPHGWEKKRLLGEGAHAALDVGGLGILAAPELHKLLTHKG
jgi:hypothetical protein